MIQPADLIEKQVIASYHVDDDISYIRKIYFARAQLGIERRGYENLFV
jgi:hypothetical protein